MLLRLLLLFACFWSFVVLFTKPSGADQGFLERWFQKCNGGGRFAAFIAFFLNITEAKLFHFHGIFKNGRQGREFVRTP